MPKDIMICYGDDINTLVAAKYMGPSDQRFPYLGVAYIEWKGTRPSHCLLRFTYTCHECGFDVEGEKSGYTGFFSWKKPCPSCSSSVEGRLFRVWEHKDLERPGLVVIAMPYTTRKGIAMRPIKLRILEVTTVEE